ncbi:MAG: hypothetical protein JO031_00010 [Ktedonobacteraceae bacterium]|nr:hypothetical protein [Ktedonobacteraceae bacterium]
MLYEIEQRKLNDVRAEPRSTLLPGALPAVIVRSNAHQNTVAPQRLPLITVYSIPVAALLYLFFCFIQHATPLCPEKTF